MITEGFPDVELYRPAMRIFTYEHVTGGGMLGGPSPRASSLFTEAASMMAALTHDIHGLPEGEAVLLLDDRLRTEEPDEARLSIRRVATAADCERQFDVAVGESDYVLLIAPETGGALTRLARRVEELGGRLLSPSSEFCAWASDKSRVAETLQAAGAPVPRGVRLRYDDPWPGDFPMPAVLKPNDGCGSQDVRLVKSPNDDARTNAHEFWRLEEYVAGQAASRAVIRGTQSTLWLAPCLQDVAEDGSFRYLGGSAPVSEHQAARIEAVLKRCYPPIPDFYGYIGFDLVLGVAEDGSQDCLIEVNPRLTTSYHAHHALFRNNLVAAMINLLEGRSVVPDTRGGSIRFSPDGRVVGIVERN